MFLQRGAVRITIRTYRGIMHNKSDMYDDTVFVGAYTAYITHICFSPLHNDICSLMLDMFPVSKGWIFYPGEMGPMTSARPLRMTLRRFLAKAPHKIFPPQSSLCLQSAPLQFCDDARNNIDDWPFFPLFDFIETIRADEGPG